MTARAERRRQVTRRAMVATAVALVTVVVAGVVGARALYKSTDGSDASSPERPVRTLPRTPNVLVGVVDEHGQLASLAVFTDAPGRPGGSIVSIPTNAAMTAGGEEVSLASQFDGSRDSLNKAAGAVLGVAFGDVVLLDEEQLLAALPAVDDVSVDLPADVVDDLGATGRIAFDAGELTMTTEDVAAALAAHASSPVTGGEPPVADENDVAIWHAVAAAVDEGVDAEGTLPESMRERPAGVIESLYGGRVRARGLQAEPVDGNTDLVGVSRSDVLLVFGQISPRLVASPAASVNVRLVVRYPDGTIPDGGVADVASRAIDRLIVAQTNVVSVETGEGEAPPVTRVEVVTAGTEPLVEELGTQLFGETTVEVTEYDVRGVDIIVTLGESFLQELERIGQTGD